MAGLIIVFGVVGVCFAIAVWGVITESRKK